MVQFFASNEISLLLSVLNNSVTKCQLNVMVKSKTVIWSFLGERAFGLRKATLVILCSGEINPETDLCMPPFVS